MINIISSSRYKINRRLIKSTVDKRVDGVSMGNGTLNVVFVGKNKMKAVATKYKNEPVALPVLSFKYDEPQTPNGLLAEIIICYPQAVLLAAEREKKVDDMINYLVDHAIDTLDI